MAEGEVIAASQSATAPLPDGARLRVVWTPLSGIQPLPGRVCGITAAEATPSRGNGNLGGVSRSEPRAMPSWPSAPSQPDLIALERQLRSAATASGDRLLLGLNARPVFDLPGNRQLPIMAAGPGHTLPSSSELLMAGAGRAGVYQLMTFPVARFNGVGLPAGSRIRVADPSRWFRGLSETRLFQINTSAKSFYAWDAHAPVGNTPHNFYHVNQRGTYALFAQSNHANLSGTQLIQARQLRYLKIGGRVFLVVGVVVDTVQLGGAAMESVEQGSPRPIAAQAVRTAGGWAMAWAGAKAGMFVGGLAGVETGPGMVLTAIGGGLIGGTAGYFGADWIADWIYED